MHLPPCTTKVFALNNSTVSCVVQMSVKMHLHVVFFIGFGFGFKEWSDLLRKKCFSDCEKHLEIQGREFVKVLRSQKVLFGQ